jgi:hypothetical protein
LSRFHRLVLLAAAALLAFSAFAVAASPEPTPQPFPNVVNDPNVSGTMAAVTPDEEPLVPPGPAPDIILIYTGRALGYVEPCG